MPFCKGCGHSHVLRKLNEALVQLQVPPSNLCLVTDIGCIGLADSLFKSLHTVHTTHGRSSAFATGIQIADSILADSKLKTIVLVGDGGAMIGIQHLVNAALMNVTVTVLLCNNFLFGMTGGQNSAFSPFDFLTPTTPRGNIIPPIDMCRVMVDCGAEYVIRKTATDKDLVSAIASAIEHPGFALVEIVELCTEHATEQNSLTGKSIARILEFHHQQLGPVRAEVTRSEFSRRYSDKYPAHVVVPNEKFITPLFKNTLEMQVGIVVAGSAGERVQSSAKKLCDAAMLAGLHCTQKNDNPVTQGSGFSISEVIISPKEIFYTGIDAPDAVIVVSYEGLQELKENQILGALHSNSVLIVDTEMGSLTTMARVYTYPFRKEYGPEKAALRAIEFYLNVSGIFPLGAFGQ
jgi:Pyruvate:ferredoxin oxidoreductase and related 2-oxoacid:ferredoxin oxidoreductases, beta subunit